MLATENINGMLNWPNLCAELRFQRGLSAFFSAFFLKRPGGRAHGEGAGGVAPRPALRILTFGVVNNENFVILREFPPLPDRQKSEFGSFSRGRLE